MLVVPAIALIPDGIEPTYSYLRAKQLAEDHQKSYVLYFSAEWCSPCSFMEETTFQDKNLQQLIAKNHFFVKLDIDQFEGYALKEYYGVYSLPTFLFFTPDHKLVKRKEGALSPAVLKDFLSTDKKSYTSSFPRSGILSNYSPKSLFHTDSHTPILSERNEEESLQNEMASKNYSIQIGAFASYDNARLLSVEIKQYTDQDVQIISDLQSETYIYKVYVGRFESKEDAIILLSILKTYGMTGMVKSTSSAVKT